MFHNMFKKHSTFKIYNMAYEISETYFKLAIVKSESITNLFFLFSILLFTGVTILIIEFSKS